MNNFSTKSFKFYCGVDLHKKKSFIYILNKEGKKVKSVEIQTSRDEIEKIFSHFNPGEILVAVEIGSLTFYFCDILRKMEISVYVVNTLENHYLSHSIKKTDKQDARKLAIQLWKNILPRPIYIPNKEEMDIRRLISHRHYLVKQLTRLKNRTHYILSNFDIKINKRVLKIYAQWEMLSNKVNHINDEILTFKFSLLYQEYKRVQEQVLEIEKLLFKKISDNSRFSQMYEKLFTIPGMGRITISALIGCVGYIDRFSDVRQFVSYLGLCPKVRESGGKSLGNNGLTKRGNSLLRGYFTQVATAVLRSKNVEALPLQMWYERLRKKKGWRKARIALARKIAAISFGVLKNNSFYQPDMIKVEQKKDNE